MIKELFVKYKSLIVYGILGVLTTAVNMAAYFLCHDIMRIENVPSTVIAWLLAVLVAFITNKLWAFDSRSFDNATLRHELLSFIGCRVATGVLDVAIMYAAVDVMGYNASVFKFLSNLCTIVLNYVASKVIIFRNHCEK